MGLLSVGSVRLGFVRNASCHCMLEPVISTSNKTSRNGNDAQNAIYSSKGAKAATTWCVDVTTNSATSAGPIGLTNITNARLIPS